MIGAKRENNASKGATKRWGYRVRPTVSNQRRVGGRMFESIGMLGCTFISTSLLVLPASADDATHRKVYRNRDFVTDARLDSITVAQAPHRSFEVQLNGQSFRVFDI
jgi:hypothetical protein